MKKLAMVGVWGAALAAVVALGLAMQPVAVPPAPPEAARVSLTAPPPVAPEAPEAPEAHRSSTITLKTVWIVGERPTHSEPVTGGFAHGLHLRECGRGFWAGELTRSVRGAGQKPGSRCSIRGWR
jgi:hypothetical protein